MTNLLKGVAGRLWWLVALRGGMLVLFGLLALIWPGATIVVVATIFGIFSILDGIGEIVYARADRAQGRSVGWTIAMGVMSILAGLIALIWPGLTALALLLIIAVWALVSSAAGIAHALRARRAGQDNWGWRLTFSILIGLFGLALMVNPGAGLISLALVVGIWAIIAGVSLLTFGFAARRLSRSA